MAVGWSWMPVQDGPWGATRRGAAVEEDASAIFFFFFFGVESVETQKKMNRV